MLDTLPISEKHVLQLSATPGGWSLRVQSEQGELLGHVAVSPQTMSRLIRRGTTITQGPIQIRGLKWEIEFRQSGELLGRIRKDAFLAAMNSESPQD